MAHERDVMGVLHASEQVDHARRDGVGTDVHFCPFLLSLSSLSPSFDLFSPSPAIPPISSPSLSLVAADSFLNAWPAARHHSPSLCPRFCSGYQCQPPPRHLVDRQWSGPHRSSTFFSDPPVEIGLRMWMHF